MTRDVNVVEKMAAGTSKWILLPKPIAALSKPAKRAEFEKAVKDARYELIHDSWEEALEAARELSDRGGIETVQLVHMVVKPNAVFKDGKQIAKK